ncbi:MAG: cell division protein FtsA [Nitrospirae bacterium CG_4_10_14_0_8_um_filter_41_23]|nr:cell division protein FtsA [Nitrospirota bacterium]OIP58816.1 MAG: cell division protein FtsA [Nitrospirae bacterium CG2_30_41_42]PIQ95095.1 MAG: cell division protein FtsA [Nitrospirae bacterium CG11_big_fil_rev_8_21_14_0_20_41_14]PIV41655.1 MAG: cell division protein FtsA [Nitrospirae bacterium CG02_land_8_20_14_3_00_41_53]PIW86703.1 MAG: cell division protein FtsA [Nitrospirae bacterium CG_4_8_14_3_um_filter_41_47]PIY86260.1 MAG: cell division protein FtsA [Nitrospirae bacterium CG_4_10_
MVRRRLTELTSKSQHGSVVVGLDVGTTKICAVVGELIEGELEIRGISTSASTGLRKGMVVNIESTVESIKNAVKTAESITGVEINAVYLGITGGHIKGFNSYGAVGLRGKEVAYVDVERVIDSAKAVYVPLDREVLHVIPTGYILDGQNGIRDPVGMMGVRLEAKVYIVTGAVTSVQNLLKCCEKVGLEVVDIVFEPIASAEAVLTDDEKELGVAIVDIGGGTTDIILYKDGSLRHTSVLAIGGNHFTNDIAVGLRVSLSEAERVKKSFGSAATSMVSDSEEIDIIQAGQGRKILRRCLLEIIQPRTEELLDLIKGELISCSAYDVASTGVVLTGGCSLLEGLDRMAEAVLGLPVRIGFPKYIKGCKDIINNPIYATGVGLVLYGSDTESGRVFYPDVFTGIFGKMKDWVKGIFR